MSTLERYSLLNHGAGRNGTFLNGTEVECMNATFWAKEQFVIVSSLDLPKPSVKPYDGLDNILLLSWIRQKLSASDTQPFVWHYWDLRFHMCITWGTFSLGPHDLRTFYLNPSRQKVYFVALVRKPNVWE